MNVAVSHCWKPGGIYDMNVAVSHFWKPGGIYDMNVAYCHTGNLEVFTT